jgi:hypothetical protein
MSGMSCLTNLLEYLEELTKLMDTGRSVDIVYLDFAKASNQKAAVKMCWHWYSG